MISKYHHQTVIKELETKVTYLLEKKNILIYFSSVALFLSKSHPSN